MIKTILIWFKERKDRARMDAFKRGFEWAMSSHLIDGVSLEEIEAATVNYMGICDRETDTGRRFDRGVSYALNAMNTSRFTHGADDYGPSYDPTEGGQ